MPQKTTPKKAATKAATTKKISPLKKKSTKSVSKKTLPKKTLPKLSQKERSLDDRLAKEAIKLIDNASGFLRKSVHQSHRTTDKARDTFHKEAHSLLGKASRHLEDLLTSSTSALRKAINKV